MADGYMGPGIWIRIQHRFGPRMMEWFMAVHMALFGYILLLPTETFNQPAWNGFRELSISESLLGWTMFCVGVLRFERLVINGAMKNVTPQIRQMSAVRFDPTAINKAAAAVEAHTVAINKLIDVGAEIARESDHLAQELGRIREELRIQRELSRR